MSDYNSKERTRQLEELGSFTENVNKEIGYITDALGWTMESIAHDDKNYFTCPYDMTHRVMEQSLNKHLSTCQWKAEGYGEYDIPFPESALSPNGPFTIQLDEELQEEILKNAKEQNPEMKTEEYEHYTWRGLNVENSKFLTLIIGTVQRLLPRTSDRLIADFTTDERKALYEYVVSNTAKPEIGSDIADISTLKSQDKDKKEMSLLELLVQERNLKRRRAKHRGVHTNKKSHTEILREVINQQMEMYSEHLSEQQDYGLLTDAARCSDQQESLKNYFNKEIPMSVESSETSQKKSNGHQYPNYSSTAHDYPKERFYSRSKYKKRDRDSRDRRRETENSKKSEHKHKSHSSDHRSHKKHKYKSVERHLKKEKHKSRERTRSRHRDKSS